MKKLSLFLFLLASTTISLRADENPIHPDEREAVMHAQVAEAEQQQ